VEHGDRGGSEVELVPAVERDADEHREQVVDAPAVAGVRTVERDDGVGSPGRTDAEGDELRRG
jgi:uncharacterized protein (DUF2345 family)